MKLFLLGYLVGSVLAFFGGLDWARTMRKGEDQDADTSEGGREAD